MARKTCARKHEARALRLEGEILAASGHLVESRPLLEESVGLAEEELKTPREIWIGSAALGRVLAGLGRDKDAEAQFFRAVRTIETIAAKLKTPALARSQRGSGARDIPRPREGAAKSHSRDSSHLRRGIHVRAARTMASCVLVPVMAKPSKSLLGEERRPPKTIAQKQLERARTPLNGAAGR